MKWIGQNIWDKISRFRDHTYFEESITLGTGKSITMDEYTSGTISITKIQDSGTTFNDNDTSLMTAASIADKIEAYGYSTTAGDITSAAFSGDSGSAVSYASGDVELAISGGEGIDTTMSSGAVTIAGEDASTTNKGIVELATTAETTTGTDTGRAVTPDGLKDGFAGSTNIVTIGTLTGLVIDGDKSVTPGDGAGLHVDVSNITDSNTSASGTAARYAHVSFEQPTLLATNASVTTSDAATVYVRGAPGASTNQTITRAWSLWVDTGNARFDGSIYSGTTEALSSSGLVTVANQSNITGVGTISSGIWQGTSIATGYTAAKVTAVNAGDGIDVDTTTGSVTVTAETATDSNPGVVELATTAEANSGTDTARAITAAGLKSHVDARYSYQYIACGFSATLQNEQWNFPSQNSPQYYLWNNKNAGSATPANVDTSTTITVDKFDYQAGYVIPLACKLVGFYGDVRHHAFSPNSARPVFALFRNAELSDSSTGNITPTCVAFDKYDTSTGSTLNRSMKLAATVDVDLAAGDLLYPAIGVDEDGGTSGVSRGSFTIILKTLIP